VRDECVDDDNAISADDLLARVRLVTMAATATEYSFILYVEILTISGGRTILTCWFIKFDYSNHRFFVLWRKNTKNGLMS